MIISNLKPGIWVICTIIQKPIKNIKREIIEIINSNFPKITNL